MSFDWDFGIPELGWMLFCKVAYEWIFRREKGALNLEMVCVEGRCALRNGFGATRRG